MKGDSEELQDLILDEEKGSLLNPLRTPHWTKSCIIPWALTAFFFFTTLYSTLQPILSRSDRELGTFENGFITDFGNSISKACEHRS